MSHSDSHIIDRTSEPWRYAIHLADKHRDELGFIPHTRYEPMWHAGRLQVAHENDDPCGFLLHGPPKKTLRIYQTCISEDLRLLTHGSELFARLIQFATAANVHQITLHCADDLPANSFWLAIGCTPLPGRVRSHRRARWQRRWMYELPAGAARRAFLDADPIEQTRTKVLDLMSRFSGNAAPIARATAKRRE